MQKRFCWKIFLKKQILGRINSSEVLHKPFEINTDNIILIVTVFAVPI